jgi:CRISPR-associated endonuclease Cas2
MYVLVSYDVRSDKRRRKLFKALRSMLDHSQKSVFEGYVPEKEMPKLIRKALRYICTAEDRLKMVPLCECCREKVQAWGQSPLAEDEGEEGPIIF